MLNGASRTKILHVDAYENMKGNYVYNLNSPYGCLLTVNYKIKTCFDAVYQTLKGE